MMQPFISPQHSAELQLALRMALEYRKGGRLAEAEALCRQTLARYPGQAELLGQLGELLLERGDTGAALPLLEQARRQAPGNGQYWILLTQCLLALGRHKDAKKTIAEAIRMGLRHPLADDLLRQAQAGKNKKPDKPAHLGEALRRLDSLMRAGRYAEVESGARELLAHHARSPQAWYLLGMAILSQKRFADALEPYRRALALDRNLLAAQFNLAYALETLERLDEALEAYRLTLSIDPRLADAHNNMGNVLQKLERHQEALAAYEQAVALMPKFAPFRMNRGDALRDLERMEEAADAYQAAIDLNPAQYEAYASLGYTLVRLGRFEDAVTVSQRAIALRPDEVDAHVSLARALRHLGRHEESVDSYRRALELKPDDNKICMGLAKTLREALRYDEALAAVRRVLQSDPGSVDANYLMAGVLHDKGQLADALAALRHGMTLDSDNSGMRGVLLFNLNYQPGITPAEMLAEARAYGEKVACKAVAAVQHGNIADPERRLRVGLVSGDFGQHPVGFFLQNVLKNIDPAWLELFAYETSKRWDEINQHLHQSIPNWCEASGLKMGDEALASRIQADGIDILVDLAGHTAHNRLPVFAWKPAPVQVTWLGYFATTGVAEIDYVLADPWVLPPEEEGHFVERPWRLPDSYYCFTPPDLDVAVAGLPAKANGHITFGCFNTLQKVNDRVIKCWARVLDSVPGSHLFLKSKSLGSDAVVKDYRERFAVLGISPERLIMEGVSPRAEYLAAYNRVDIALDPFPYPGGTTSVEGLWMGVPVLTLKGDRYISHQGETILHSAGLPQWIADNEEDYVAKAAAFARDTEKLAALRAQLRGQVLASPLFDAPRFARNLEAAFRGMWRDWCARQSH